MAEFPEPDARVTKPSTHQRVQPKPIPNIRLPPASREICCNLTRGANERAGTLAHTIHRRDAESAEKSDREKLTQNGHVVPAMDVAQIR